MLKFENTLLKIVLILATVFMYIYTFEDTRFERDLHRPIRGRVYFAIAVSASGQSFSRAFNKTLTNLTQNYLFGSLKKFSYNISLEPLVIELPENGSFSSFLLEHLCDMFNGKHIVSVLVVGSSPAAFTVSLAARHAGIPVLWARGQTEFMHGFRSLENGPLEIPLAATGRELVQALRGLLLQAHWHSFTVLADPASATALRSVELWQVLEATPLHPTLVTLPSPLRAQNLFRKLADISRSTRGVVVLCSDIKSAIRILDDAKRLNMMDGHFVWIWIDTASSININSSSEEDLIDRSKRSRNPDILDDELALANREKRSAFLQGDINDMHINYLLRNDNFLLLNRNTPSVASSKIKDRKPQLHAHSPASLGTKSERKSELPVGLLSLKPLPIKIDRHLVKGAVRLLTTTFKSVINRSSSIVVQNIATNKFVSSCWEDVQRDLSFSMDFARYPERRQPFPDRFSLLKNNLINHGSFSRPKSYNKENREVDEINVLAAVEATPSTSCRDIEADVGVIKSRAQQILRKHKFKPYKTKIVQHLHRGDAERRTIFCSWYLQKIQTNRHFARSVH